MTDAERRRVPFRPAGVLGNGSLLLTLSARGEPERLFWPHVDRGQHLGELRLAILDGAGTRFVDEPPFGHGQRVAHDATPLLTEATAPGGPAVEIADAVDADEPVLVRRVRLAEPARLGVYVRPELDEQAARGSVYVDPGSGALVFFHGRTALAVGLDVPATAGCGRPATPGSALEGLRAGALRGSPLDFGVVDGALLSEAAVADAAVVVALGADPREALERFHQTRAHAREAEARRSAHDRAGLRDVPAAAPGAERSEALLRRSVLVLDLLCDRETGGIIAAPELDPAMSRCGGYGFVWGRDLAFGVLALLAARRRDAVVSALRFTLRTQQPEGLWLHRHWTDGSLAPSWGLHQIDETGATLFAYGAAVDSLGDAALGDELWPATARAARFLLGFRDPGTGLPLPSVELWEESQGQSAFAAAAVYGGLQAASRLGAARDPELAAACAAAAEGVRAAIARHLWSEERQRFLRSRLLNVPPGAGDGAAWPESDLPYPNRRVADAVLHDTRLDVSLLGLAWPFGAVPPGDPRMRRTADAVETALATADGGLLRYEGDGYAGGNPWVLARLWLGLVRRAQGDRAGWLRALAYAERAQTPLGLLPEQVDAATGEPAWVLPLAWSHAMHVLAALPELPAVEAAAVSAARAGAAPTAAPRSAPG